VLAIRKAFTGPLQFFFFVVVVIIVVTMMLPGIFGLQHFTQWGGMYTNSWCKVQIADKDPLLHTDARSEHIMAGLVTRSVWSFPMHNEESCVVWSRRYCGKQAKDGWTITWVRPHYKNEYFLDPNNACDLALPASTAIWFTDVSKE